VIITWTKHVDMSRHISFRFGDVARVNGRDYCVVTSDAAVIMLWPADRRKEPIENAPVVALRWQQIRDLHIY
jgi:hypothetical protein